jgi:hypothetical protein
MFLYKPGLCLIQVLYWSGFVLFALRRNGDISGVLKWARGKTQYSETSEVGHFCKSVVCHSWPHSYETGTILTDIQPSLNCSPVHLVYWAHRNVSYLYQSAQMKMSPHIFLLYIMPAKHSCIATSLLSSYAFRHVSCAMCFVSLSHVYFRATDLIVIM